LADGAVLDAKIKANSDAGAALAKRISDNAIQRNAKLNAELILAGRERLDLLVS
jgi:hypothetical protein